MTNHIASFKACHWLVTVHVIQFLSRQQSMPLCCLLSPRDKPMWHFTKTDHQKRGWANKDESATKKCKAITLRVKFESNIKEVIKEIADCRNVDTTAIHCPRNSRYVARETYWRQIYRHKWWTKVVRTKRVRRTDRWHLVYSQCCTTTTSLVSNFFITPRKQPRLIK